MMQLLVPHQVPAPPPPPTPIQEVHATYQTRQNLQV